MTMEKALIEVLKKTSKFAGVNQLEVKPAVPGVAPPEYVYFNQEDLIIAMAYMLADIRSMLAQLVYPEDQGGECGNDVLPEL